MKIQLPLSFLIAGLLTGTVIAQQLDSAINAQNTLIFRVDSLMANYKFDKALDLLAAGDSSQKEILLRIGQCHFRLGALSSAIRPLERLLQVDSVNATALNQLGQLYARNGDYIKSLSSFTRLIAIDPANSYYYKQAGAMTERLGDLAAARPLFRKALDLNPADSEASVALGNIQLEMGEYESVDSIVNLALSLEPLFKPLLLLQAKSAFEQQHYESAIITVNTFLQNSDTTAICARLLGLSYYHLHDYAKVITCMAYLLNHRYDYEWIYYYMGLSARELGNEAASIAWLRMAVQKSISVNTKIYYSELGQTYEAAGDYEAAIKAYRTAYNYSKDDILLYHLARNYDFYYKDKTTALEYYQRYLDSDDTIRLAKEYAKKRLQDMGKF